MTCSELLEAYLTTLAGGFHCSSDSHGRLRVVTPYLYPDHDFIEVFVKQAEDRVVVSDLGETLRHMDTLGMDVLNTPGLKFASERITHGLKVEMFGGAIFKKGSTADIGRILFDVLTAVKLVSSLLYGNRAYEPRNFDEEVQDFVESHGIEAERRYKTIGETGMEYIVSFKLKTPRGESLLQTISPRTKAGAKPRIDATFRMWSDIGKAPRWNQKISLLNDDPFTFRRQDLAILERVSAVHRWTERQALIERLQPVS